MFGYFGTDAQRALQKRSVEAIDWIRTTPGACVAGRFIGCDDVDRLGWENIDPLLDRDGVFGFRMFPVDQIASLSAHLSKRGFRDDHWNVFVADRDAALAASKRVLAKPLPSGFSTGTFPREYASGEMVAVQNFMAANGIVPFPGIMLAGDLCPSAGVTILYADELLAATAYGYLPHNESSRYRSYAFGGLACVSEQYRGRGLGAYVNALMVVKVFAELDAGWIYEMVNETNLSSRRMVEASGLVRDPAVTGCVATRVGEPRFTR